MNLRQIKILDAIAAEVYNRKINNGHLEDFLENSESYNCKPIELSHRSTPKSLMKKDRIAQELNTIEENYGEEIVNEVIENVLQGYCQKTYEQEFNKLQTLNKYQYAFVSGLLNGSTLGPSYRIETSAYLLYQTLEKLFNHLLKDTVLKIYETNDPLANCRNKKLNIVLDQEKFDLNDDTLINNTKVFLPLFFRNTKDRCRIRIVFEMNTKNSDYVYSSKFTIDIDYGIFKQIKELKTESKNLTQTHPELFEEN